MKQFIDAIRNALRNDTRTLKEISEGSGVQITRVFRLNANHLMKEDDLVKLADFYGITPASILQTSIHQAREEAIKQAWQEVYEKAELKVAEKYGITPTQLEWRVTDPKFTKAV